MKLAVFNPVLYEYSLEQALEYLNKLGVLGIEIGVGGNPNNTHLNIDEYLDNEQAIAKLTKLLAKYQIEIAALSLHSNHVSPNKEEAKQADVLFKKACRLAKQLGVSTIITFPGCPGSHKDSTHPNWVTCAWPLVYQEILDYQWNEVLIPYWKEALQYAAKYDVKVALELHPGFCVYNPQTMKKLRDATYDNIGANLDPSHLYWQGIDIIYALRYLKDMIFHFHAKDTYINEYNTKTNGVLDTNSYDDYLNRSWSFVTVGYGHSQKEWNQIISSLQMNGYNGWVSIEHEDGLMSNSEGLEKSIKLLNEVLIHQDATKPYWI